MKEGLNAILSFADESKGKTGSAYYRGIFRGGREESLILGKEEGRKLSNMTKRFGEKAGEGDEKLEHSSSAKRLTGGLGKTAQHVYLGKGLGVGKVGGSRPRRPLSYYLPPYWSPYWCSLFCVPKKDGMGWLKM